MKTKTGLLALGVFTVAGALTVACGGSDSSDGTPTAGSSGTTAGTSSGGSSSGGKSSSAGTTNSGAGTATNNGGTTSNGGRPNNQGGFNPGAGGAGVPDCPTTAMDGEDCTPMSGGNNVCQVDETSFCVCQGQNDTTWTCTDLGDLGAGGDGGLGGTVTCPAAPKNGDTCTGLGLCPGSQTCGCGFGMVYCQP